MSGRATALMESVPNPIATSAAAPDFDQAFTLHHRAVYRAAHSVVRDPALAEDVTQEVFLRFYKHIETTPGEDLLRPWLLRVAINVARNTIRGNTRAVAREQEFFKQGELDGVHIAEPEMEFERRTQVQEARRALEKIKEPMRSCLLLKQQGLSYREIAQTLEVNEANVGSLVARGRKEFARLFGKIGVNR